MKSNKKGIFKKKFPKFRYQSIVQNILFRKY
jgi:hypothetical protein